MSMLASVTSALRRARLLLSRDRSTKDLETEMRLHLDLRAARYVERGLSADEARVATRRRFGNALALGERSRDEWGFHWLEDLWQDVRYGARMLRRGPGFAVIAVGAVGIAIGVNAGFFTLIDALAWRPLPVAHPERLVRLQTLDARNVTSIRFAYSEVTTIAAHARTIQDVVGYDAEPMAVKASPAVAARPASIGFATGNYFIALGGSAQLGRVLSPNDDRVDGSPVVVISDAYWTSAFARAPTAIGHDIVVNGTHATIVGIANASFVGANPLVPDMWMTLAQGERVGGTPGRLLDPKNRFIVVHARLRAGATMQQAVSELSGFIAEPPVPASSPDAQLRVVGARLQPSESLLPPDARVFLALAPALFVVGLVLVIACSNLANLLLSRALVRQREIAVRLAMGASRNRLVRQLLTESLLIAAAGAIVGFALSSWTVSIISRSYFSFVPSTYGTLMLALHPSWRVVIYTIVLAAVSALTFGLAPALHATSPNLNGMLKGDDAAAGGHVRRSRLRDGLIVAQVAGSVVLIAAAAILTRGVARFASARSGIVADRVSLASFGLAPRDRLTPLLVSDRATFAARVAHASGVAATARGSSMPFSSWPLTRVRVGESNDDESSIHALPTDRITPSYFDVVGQSIVDGRAFSAADSATNAPVAIVTQAAARALWPATRAAGQKLRMLRANGEVREVVQVVGVATDAHSMNLWDDDTSGYVYRPATDSDFATVDMPLLVRSDLSAPVLVRTLRDIATSVDRDEPLDVKSLTSVHDQEVVPFRYAASITASIAAL